MIDQFDSIVGNFMVKIVLKLCSFRILEDCYELAESDQPIEAKNHLLQAERSNVNLEIKS